MHTHTPAQPALTGASYAAFAQHPGYRRMFAPDALTLGIFLPLRSYQGQMQALSGQARLVSELDRQGFAAVWVRDVPLLDPAFGDAGQVFDPFTYLAFLAAKTESIALATGSAIVPLRHPIDLAKAAKTIDQLSGGRLVLGVASGDRPTEFPAYGMEHAERGERFAQSIAYFRQLMATGDLHIDSPLGSMHGLQHLPPSVSGQVPLLMTGASQQSLPWLGTHADGWLTYPGPTHNRVGPQRLAEKIKAWRALIPDQGFRPHITNEWIDLVDDPHHPATPLHHGFVLQTGRKALIELLHQWREAGVNHAALGIQHAQRPPAQVLQELAEEVLPLFPSLAGPLPSTHAW